jgi:hypothetical protein
VPVSRRQIPGGAMTIENKIRPYARIFILASIGLTVYHSLNWIFLDGFVGLNLLQSSVRKFCPLEMIMKKVERKKGCSELAGRLAPRCAYFFVISHIRKGETL